MAVQWHSSSAGTHRVDVVVMGAGQAGLVTGYFLRRTGYDFVLYERAPRIGDAWRHRYDALVLFSPRASSALPACPCPGTPKAIRARMKWRTTWKRTHGPFTCRSARPKGSCP
jgi:cation diffusion facilitator CzcD-associated flavoprotein CzcO